VAGRFYPADAGELAESVDELLDGVPVADDDELAAAYVVPHAGYRYSGPIAAQVYARLRRHAGQIGRVVLVGPAHYVPVAGCAAPSTVGWLTPLGEVPVDAAGVRALAQRGHVVVDDRPHAPEHSLEVQLPFLQRALPPGIAVLPIVAGRSSVDRVAAALEATVEPGTIVLCSTDLSHYLDQAAARRQDDQTARAVLDLAAERIGIRDACGAFALRGLVAWARGNALRPCLLGLGTSADTIGDPARVVGYAAFAFAGFVTPPSGDRPVKTFGQ
jgi:AmmeMemoRadiSam system protein B